MNKNLLIMMVGIVLFCPFVLGEYVTSTTVQVNVTNNSVQLTGEENSVFSFVTSNSSSATYSWSHNIRRNVSSDFNYSLITSVMASYNYTSIDGVKLICDQNMNVLKSQVQNVSDLLQKNLQYFPLYNDCFYNLTEARKNLEDKAEIVSQRDLCVVGRAKAESDLSDCSATLRTTSASESQCKKDLSGQKSLIPLWIILGGLAVFGFYYFKEKKKHGKEGFGTLDTK